MTAGNTYRLNRPLLHNRVDPYVSHISVPATFSVSLHTDELLSRFMEKVIAVALEFPRRAGPQAVCGQHTDWIVPPCAIAMGPKKLRNEGLWVEFQYLVCTIKNHSLGWGSPR